MNNLMKLGDSDEHVPLFPLVSPREPGNDSIECLMSTIPEPFKAEKLDLIGKEASNSEMTGIFDHQVPVETQTQDD